MASNTLARLHVILVTLAASFPFVGSTEAAEHTIRFGGSLGLAYEPASLTVAPGDTVTWVGSLGSHPLISDGGLWPENGSGDRFSFTFPSAGDFAYHCGRHRIMKGQVKVVAAPAPGPSATAQPVAPVSRFALETVVDGLENPVGLVPSPDSTGRLFAVEQPGRIRVIEKGTLAAGVYLDIQDIVASGGEKGLLGLAFHPGFAQNGKLYVNFTTRSPQLRTVIAEFQAPPGAATATRTSMKEILAFDQPFSNHNGGDLAFGPDGFLYIAVGDGGSAGDPQNHAQRLDSLLGKILRIAVGQGDTYSVPADNPFVGRTGARPEIWAYGFRNPWRISFDRVTGQLYTGDVGQETTEEVDLVEKGKNYGWKIMEGDRCFTGACDPAGLAMPVKTYDHSQGFSITGGYVYRGTRLPELSGAYLYGDFGSGRIWTLRLENGIVTEDRLLMATDQPISSFGQSLDGEIHVVLHSGQVARIVRVSAEGETVR